MFPARYKCDRLYLRLDEPGDDHPTVVQPWLFESSSQRCKCARLWTKVQNVEVCLLGFVPDEFSNVKQILLRHFCRRSLNFCKLLASFSLSWVWFLRDSMADWRTGAWNAIFIVTSSPQPSRLGTQNWIKFSTSLIHSTSFPPRAPPQ